MKQIALATVAQSHNAISLESILENTTIVRLRNQEELIEYIKNLEMPFKSLTKFKKHNTNLSIDNHH
jgi:hypothetical protein